MQYDAAEHYALFTAIRRRLRTFQRLLKESQLRLQRLVTLLLYKFTLLLLLLLLLLLPRDARNAKRGIAIVSRPSCNGQVGI